MNKYLSLISNTLIFAIGTFSSKLLVFLLMPLYTRVLTTSDYGVMDIVVNTSNLLIPIVMVSINEAVIRFGLDKSVKKSSVFTTGLAVTLTGFAIFALFIPVMKQTNFISGYSMMIYAYVLAACLKSVVSQFVRTLGYIKLYAFDGLMNTLLVVIFNILLLVVFKLGVNGYVLSVILANVITTIGLFVIANLKRYVKIRSFDKNLLRSMIMYALPLMPTTIFWWITNVSDRFLVTYYLGQSVNGLYSVAYKIPTLITLMSGIFTQAWQLSAVAESDAKNRNKFYSDIFKSYQTVVFMSASIILLMIKPITKVLVSDAFYPSWEYVPFLVMSVVFSCFVTFLGTFYMVAKKNTMALVTTAIGGILNIILNIKYIPIKGAMGAAFATFISYFIVFLFRAIDTRRFVQLKYSIIRMVLNTTIITAQVGILIFDVKYGGYWQFLMVVFITIVNLKIILQILYRAYLIATSKVVKGR